MFKESKEGEVYPENINTKNSENFAEMKGQFNCLYKKYNKMGVKNVITEKNNTIQIHWHKNSRFFETFFAAI